MTSKAYEDMLQTRKKIEELGKFCVQFGIEKADLQMVASQKILENQKVEDRRKKSF